MAVQFDHNALGRFADVDFRKSDAIANLDGKDGLKQDPYGDGPCGRRG